jgi:hypothetical protein
VQGWNKNLDHMVRLSSKGQNAQYGACVGEIVDPSYLVRLGLQVAHVKDDQHCSSVMHLVSECALMPNSDSRSIGAAKAPATVAKSTMQSVNATLRDLQIRTAVGQALYPNEFRDGHCIRMDLAGALLRCGICNSAYFGGMTCNMQARWFMFRS